MRRIIFLIAIFLLTLSPLMGQDPQVVLPEDGNWPTIVGDSIMLIGPKQEALTEEQRYFNPPYLLVYPGKEHLKEQMIRAALCDCDPTQPNRRIGVFSVAADKQVSFSQGNLQYLPAINLWKFANTQYDYLGNANKYLKPTFRNWVDLFGWSANNTTAPFGVSTSTNVADYAGNFVDWGENEICGDAPGTWRTLSRDEWEYLLNGRDNASQLRFRAQVNNVNGFVFLPDQWLCPEGIELKIEPLTTQVFTFDAWSKMENAGAVFLPAAGRLNDKQLVNFDDHGNYWSSTRIDNTNVDYFAFTFSTNKLHVDHQSPIHFARSVRLVHDTIVSQPIPEPCLVVKVNDTLSINMMCVEGGTFMMGRGENAHEVTLSDYYISECELTQAQWEAVMGEIPHNGFYHIEKYGDNYPMSGISLMECQAFVDRLNTMTDLHFRIPTEAEWEYAARGGKKSRGYTYAGSNDIDEVAIYAGTVRLDENGEVIYAPEPVMTRKPNELGIYDMSGNLCEWVNDWNGAYMHNLYPQINPSGNMVSGSQSPHAATENCPSTNSHTIHYMGGCWTQAAYQCEVAHKFSLNIQPTRKLNGVGLRLVLSDEEPFKMVYVDDTTRIVLRPVKGGTFMMGQGENAHEVTLSDYYMSECEVTQHLWKAVMGNIPTGNKNPSHPVGQVTYADCQDFITKLSNLTGLYFQLPTEAEWEYAAMGGNKSHGYIYSGSNTIDDVAWYDQNSENTLHYVGAKQPNELGIYDMSGNAWEWCADYYGPYSTEPQTNPQGPATGTDRVIRSGSFRTTAERCSNKHRQSREADYPDSHITFRLVLHDTKPTPEPEYVDLGLSVKWATFNVGATSPEDYGDYFAWGETEPKEEYNWATYKWCDGTDANMTKYCSDSLYDNADYKTTLDPEDDAAIVRLGGNWRMPAKEEWMELKQKCTWERITINGITGYQVTGKNGNSIFLPRAGLRIMKEPHAADSVGYYASSSHISKYKNENYFNFMRMCDSIITTSSGLRYYGYPIRPVYDDRPDPCLVVKVNDTLSINLMCVEGGTMYIGRGDTVNRPYRQRPLRQVTISDFYLGQTEVTQELWLAIMGENPTYFPCDTCLCHPVDSVSIDEVLLFIERLNSLTGYNFRLPTEAEWEYAARGGVRSKGYAYAGSDNVNEVAWCRVGDSRGGTPHPVAQKRPNELGLYDMHGNLWEFVHDKFVDDINIYPSVNPTGPGGMRGSATGCGSAYYSALMPENTWGWVGTGGGRSRWFGFRLALSDQDPFVPITIGKYRFHMMYVQGGTFMMGSDAPNAEPNEKPVHEVILSDYYIGQTEVTQKLWKLVMGNDNNPSANKGDELPVTNITWDEAQVFVEKLSEMTGLHFRLPTEAEWEYAARGGQRSQGYTYAGSDDIDEVGWYNVNSANKTHNVGQKMPNELGIYDMTGNVYEFCQDWYGPYSAESQDNPTGPTSSTKNLRVCRGGAFVNPSNVQLYCRVTRRDMAWDDKRYAHGGLRIVLDPNPKPTPVPPEPEYVDLGLSVKWATFNVGATSPEDYGDYFAWGETEPKEEYSWATYKWCQGTANTLTKYCSNGQYGNVDYKTILDPEDDAAIVHWGSDWRMPTIDEWLELKQKCSWKKIIINGITGYQVTAENGNSIFLPRAGLRMSNILYAADSVGYYASISHLPQFHKEDYASYMLMYDSSISKSSAVRYYGLPIRPVYDDRPDPCLMVKVNDTLSINMMCVEGGTFMMGAMEGDEIAKDDEKPAHKVTLTYDYHIMQTEVTQSLWEAVTGEDIYVAQTKMANASKPAYVGGNYPMYYVRMNDALEFIDKLNAMTGMHFRLPTEAEWEYAARGGNKSKGYLYAGSNNAEDVGWYTGRGMHHVAKLKPNELGIYDMSGNVGEMCLDYGTYGETYKAGDVVNPRGNIRANGNRFWRGGSYTHSKDSMRVSQRSSYTPSWDGTWLGLRLVLAEDNDFRTIRVGNSYFDMSFVKGGTFMMGSDAPDAEADEQPVHEVTLSDYYIGQTEVTQHLWKAVMGDENNPSVTKGNNLPVTNISWDEAQTFVDRLSEMTGMHFRLPTEAEWEYAARGGQKSKGYTYAGSDDIDEVGWYASNSDNKTHSVGQKLPNELGMYDMTGNVWEWCTDTFDNNSEGHKEAVLRGGAYDNQASTCQIASSRALRKITHITHFAGFRVVLEPEKHYRYGYTQEDWDAATSSWGHTGRGHAPADQSCIQGTMVRGIRLKVARVGSLNVYKVPSLLEKNEDNFELVATLTTDSTGVQDFDFAEPIYIAPNEYLVFGKPSEEEPTLRPCWFSGNGNSLPDKAKGVAHYIGTEEASIGAPNGSLMVEFY